MYPLRVGMKSDVVFSELWRFSSLVRVHPVHAGREVEDLRRTPVPFVNGTWRHCLCVSSIHIWFHVVRDEWTCKDQKCICRLNSDNITTRRDIMGSIRSVRVEIILELNRKFS